MSKRAASVLAGLILSCGPALAHPHVWITARSEVVFDGPRLVGFRHSWTFDPAYSAYAVQGMGPRRDGVPDPGELAALAKANIEALEEWNWYTSAKVNGAAAEFAPPTEYGQTLADGRLTLRFLVPLKASMAVKVAALQVSDPSFFVALNFAEDASAVTLVGAPRGCVVNLRRPQRPAEEGMQLLADDIANALAGKGSAVPQSDEFATQTLVACP